jgi:hypothetical protein
MSVYTLHSYIPKFANNNKKRAAAPRGARDFVNDFQFPAAVPGILCANIRIHITLNYAGTRVHALICMHVCTHTLSLWNMRRT